jgi:hypothetical protein
MAKSGGLTRDRAMITSLQQPVFIPETEQSQVRELHRFLCGSQTSLINVSREDRASGGYIPTVVWLVEILPRGQAST